MKKLLPVLYEDDLLVAVAKPSGIDAGGGKTQTLPGVCEILTALRGKDEPLEPANRLSRYESGVLLLGKDPSMIEHIRQGLRAKRVELEYVAVVLGKMKSSRMPIAAALGASRGKRRPNARGTKRPAAREVRRSPDISAEATTMLTRKRESRGRTLVRCHTRVENSHALRAGLRAVGLRVLGDNLHDTAHRRQASRQTCLHLSAVAFHHPGTGSRVSIHAPDPNSFAAVMAGERDPLRALHAGLVRRLPLIASRQSNAFRLLTGNAEDLPGLVVEQYGDVVILQMHSKSTLLADALPTIAKWYRELLGIDSVYVKPFVKDRVNADEDLVDDMHSPHPLLGQSAPAQIKIRERDLRFAIKPYAGFSTGLFLDERDNRSRVRSLADDKDVLNLFAYTCGYSVAAAAGRAASTVSVDISPKSLEWGRTNFGLNGLEAGNHVFRCTDAADYLKRAKRQEMAFDLIIIAPPTFAHGRKGGKRFSIATDLTDLVTGSVAILRPRGVMVISTNYRRFTMKDLRDRIREGFGGRGHRFMTAPPLPADFAVDADHAKTVYIRLT